MDWRVAIGAPLSHHREWEPGLHLDSPLQDIHLSAGQPTRVLPKPGALGHFSCWRNLLPNKFLTRRRAPVFEMPWQWSNRQCWPSTPHGALRIHLVRLWLLVAADRTTKSSLAVFIIYVFSLFIKKSCAKHNDADLYVLNVLCRGLSTFSSSMLGPRWGK